MVIALAFLIAVPAVAAEGPTKGTKSYQAARSEQPAQTQEAQPTQAQDAANIAPAAGDTAEAQDADGQTKTMREEMRLPRKH